MAITEQYPQPNLEEDPDYGLEDIMSFSAWALEHGCVVEEVPDPQMPDSTIKIIHDVPHRKAA